jgi:hypothetical protein
LVRETGACGDVVTGGFSGSDPEGQGNRLEGIRAQAGVTDLGGSKARANGEPAGCSTGAIACGP